MADFPSLLPIILLQGDRVSKCMIVPQTLQFSMLILLYSVLPGNVVRMKVDEENEAVAKHLISSDDRLVACIPKRNDHGQDESSPKHLDKEGRLIESLYDWGCLARVTVSQKGNILTLHLQGMGRVKILSFNRTAPFIEATVEYSNENALEFEDQVIGNLRNAGKDLIGTLTLPSKILNQLKQIMDSSSPLTLSDLLCSMIDLNHAEKLEVLSTPGKERIELTLKRVLKQIQVSNFPHP